MKKGFTLVELLVVITIMAIIMAVATVSYQKTIQLSRDSKRKTDLELVRQALETYRSEKGAYPITSGAISTSLTALTTGSYITSIPADPQTNTYAYKSSATGTTYALCASLETVTTGALAACAGLTCVGTCNYVVTQP